MNLKAVTFSTVTFIMDKSNWPSLKKNRKKYY